MCVCEVLGGVERQETWSRQVGKVRPEKSGRWPGKLMEAMEHGAFGGP